jgi:hypothetical protein
MMGVTVSIEMADKGGERVLVCVCVCEREREKGNILI